WTISVNRKLFHVRPNLRDALIRLRELGLAEYYWVDFICINQSDLQERSTQVSTMDRIYRSATQVDIWLGDHTGETEKLGSWIEKVSA
ncbi:heterokaryon incompatibility, partial [Immersiella caudata]